MSQRLFVAVDVAEGVRESLARQLEDVRRAHRSLRWTSSSSWHVTLAFLGWVADERAEQVDASVTHAAARARPFELSLDGSLGTFGGRVLWVGLRDSAPLRALAPSVRRALASHGFDCDERPFRAHLTVARAPKGGRVPREATDVAVPQWSWAVEEIVVLRSHLSRSGARYELRYRAPLSR